MKKMNDHLRILGRATAAVGLVGALTLLGCGGDGKGGTAKASAAPADPKACTSYADKLCEKGGDTNALCGAARTLGPVLSAAACTEALKDMSAAFAKIETMGKACQDLPKRLCADLGEDTQTIGAIRSH